MPVSATSRHLKANLGLGVSWTADVSSEQRKAESLACSDSVFPLGNAVAALDDKGPSCGYFHYIIPANTCSPVGCRRVQQGGRRRPTHTIGQLSNMEDVLWCTVYLSLDENWEGGWHHDEVILPIYALPQHQINRLWWSDLSVSSNVSKDPCTCPIWPAR